MAVHVQDIALEARVITDTSETIPAGIASILTRHMVTATAMVDHRAPGAPEAIRDAAIIQIAAYMWDSPPASEGVAPSARNVFRASGALAMLAPYVSIRAEAIGGDTETSTQPAGAGVDQTARDLANAARAVADANAAKLMPPSPAEAGNATATRIRGWTAALIRVVVESIVPAWARADTPPQGQGVADDAVTTPKIADDAVTSRKIAAGAITTNLIADNAVTGGKIPSDTIVSRHIGANQVGTSEIAGRAVTEAELAAAVVAKLNTMAAAGLGIYRGSFDLAAASVDSTSVAAVSAYLTNQVAGERDGDIVSAYTAATVWLYRYSTTGTPGWRQILSWSREGGGSARSDSDLEAFIERIVDAWAIQGSAEGIPGSKTFDGLFKSEEQTPIPAANVAIAFDVGTDADANEVDETDAAGTSFNITQSQANEPGAFLRCKYALTGITREGFAPYDLELILQNPSTGAVITKHNIKDSGGGSAQFAVGDAGNKRWAVRCVTRGRYAGTLTITGTEYHSAQPIADSPIEHIAEKAVNEEAEKRQEQDAVLRTEIARVEKIKAIVNGLPAATATRKGNILWRSDRDYEQTEADAFQVPETGFVQFILGNIGATGIMRAEDCHNRKQIVYAQGNHEIALNYNATRKAVLTVLNTRQNKRSSLAPDIIPNLPSPGFVMNTWAPARAGGDGGSSETSGGGVSVHHAIQSRAITFTSSNNTDRDIVAVSDVVVAKGQTVKVRFECTYQIRNDNAENLDMQIVRDSTVIKDINDAMAFPSFFRGGAMRGGIEFVETPDAGTYTYKGRGNSQSTTVKDGTITVEVS